MFIVPSTVYAVDLNQLKVKVVVDFEYPSNINKLKSDYNKDLEPLLDTLITDFGAANNFTGYSWDKEITNDILTVMGENATSGNTMYQIYPKVWFSGTNTQTVEEFNFAYDVLVGQVRQNIIDFLIANGGQNVYTHLHYSWGSADLDETF